ncbi:MAG: ubiquinone/menaquinone biosynthesis methyltransferase [Deltaproteobacteria bacterium]|jgi:demethylmenaquinone methyltransferase/2-methoxy-6-polyprenyl-1,4-benzoquinol methylase|nr:ubiquinone/menaquinone biosynthesis methyltransferase [Deltaproteobacteria bacterium]MBW2537932.1 ubiquinone/menaquinone biosynthesis methyltransferase [Deltaproteobacteria bacterium]
MGAEAERDHGGTDGSGAMFDRIAGRYDLLNRLISLGADRRWRSRLVASLGALGSNEVLDVATGTGDVALAIARAAGRAKVVGLDPSARMLAVARRKIERAGLGDRLALVEGDAQEMPFEDGRFAASCIAFGIRNVPDRGRGLREMARVTRAGGVVAVLELGRPDHGLLAPLARLHVERVVPRVGGWLSGDREYRYLTDSIRAFPSAERFVGLMRDCGLRDVRFEPMSWGAVKLFVGAAPPKRRRHVLFMCVANSARSQMAEGIARSLAPASTRLSSAGSVPTAVRPEAVQVLAEIGIDISAHRSKSIEQVDSSSVTTVITLCDEEVCPVFPGPVARLHWALPDPAAVTGDQEARLAAFRVVRDELRRRLERWFEGDRS